MRQQVDLAVLHLKVNQSWFVPELVRIAPALTRIVCHDLKWEEHGEFLPLKSDGLNISLRTDLLYHAAVRLRRFDAMLIPVSMATLPWTRKLLASIPRGPSIPVIGMFNEVQPAGMIDLLELGMIDFVQTPTNAGEIRARLLCAVSRAPRRMALRERIMGGAATYGDSTYALHASRSLGAGLTIGCANEHMAPDGVACERFAAGQATPTIWGDSSTRGWVPGRDLAQDTGVEDLPIVSRLRRVFENRYQTFGEVKAHLIAEFEAQYVRDALALQNGNVARAAAASGKNRRAFWEIMRKHKIDAKVFRDAR